MNTFLSILLSLLFFAIPWIAFGQSTQPAPLCPEDVDWTGRYHNYNYSFTIVIPPGRHGFWNGIPCVKDADRCVCMQDHGRTIPLGESAFIDAYAEHLIDSDWNLAKYQNSVLEAIQKQKGISNVRQTTSRNYRLAGAPASRFVISFDKGGQGYIEEHVITIYEGEYYDLSLRTEKGMYQTSRKEFEQVMASWEFNHEEPPD